MLSDAGIIENVFSQHELEEGVKYFSKMSKHYVDDNGNSFTAISQEHILYNWFCKNFFSKIQNLTDVDIQMIHGSYLDEKTPWNLHSDYYLKSLRPSIGDPYKAFLIPISVNEDTNQTAKTNTVIFNETDIYVPEANKKTSWSKKLWLLNRVKKENNATVYGDGLLSHLLVEDLECLTVKLVANWKSGNVIYWDERLLHSSDNFIKNGVYSKQALVIHTYVV
jgi:hypothetical protein